MGSQIITNEKGHPQGFFLCTRKVPARRCVFCDRPSVKLCDYPVGEGKTCDRPLCVEHAVSAGLGKDHCYNHPKK